MRFWAAWSDEERAAREVGPGKMLISKPIGWRGTGNPLGWNAIGLPVTGWISGGPHEVWMMTWTPVLLLSLSSPLSLSLASMGMPHAMRSRMHGILAYWVTQHSAARLCQGSFFPLRSYDLST